MYNPRTSHASSRLTLRQQPETAMDTVVVTIEDETGSVNVIVWKDLPSQPHALAWASA